MKQSQSKRLRAEVLQDLPVRQVRHTFAGVSTSILEGGEGPPIVLLHGPGEHAAKWMSVLPALVETQRVIAPDLPGHGASRVLEGRLDAGRAVAWLAELIAETCGTPPVLVGQLLGGALAARFALAHGDRLAALVLVDALGLAPFQPRPEFMTALGDFMMNPAPDTHERLWRRRAFDLDRLRTRLGAAWDRLEAYNLDRARAADLAADQEQLMRELAFTAIPAPELARMPVPTTLVWGRSDLATDVEVAVDASARYHWPLHVIDDAGDDPPLENPEAFLAALGPILAARDTRAGWEAVALGYDRTNTPTQMRIAEEGLRRVGLGEGMRFLDVASGSGALAVPAARLGARVVAVDLAPTMLELLRQHARGEGLDIDTRVMDGHALALPDASFDVAGSQFGVMLFPDLPRALREMARVVKPGGRVLIHAYGDPGEIDFLRVLVGAVKTVRPDFDGPPSDPPPLEFQLADPRRLGQELARAGLTDVRVETVEEVTEFASGAALWDWITSSNPIVEHILGMLQITADERGAIAQALDAVVRQRAGAGGVAILRNPVHVGIGARAMVGR